MGSTFFSSLSVDTIECKTMRIEDANLTLLLDTRMPLFKFQANKQLRWNLFSLETFQTKYQHVFFKHQLKHVETALHHLIISDTDFRYIRLHGMIGLWSSHHYLIVITCIYIYTYIMHIYIWDYMGKGFGKGYSDGTQGVRMMRTYERKVPDWRCFETRNWGRFLAVLSWHLVNHRQSACI